MSIFRAKNTLLREEHGQMARAKRHFLPGHVWHITHRCHKKDFLLKFARDRCRWLQWLFEAKKRYGIRILNYMVTSNHIHSQQLTNSETITKNGLKKSLRQNIMFEKANGLKASLLEVRVL